MAYDSRLFLSIGIVRINMKKIIFAIGLAAVGSAWAKTPLPDFAPPAQGQQVVINIPQLKLFLYQDGRLLKSYNVAVGKNQTRTPIGDYKIGAKAYNPTWHVPLSIRKGADGKRLTVPPGPNNPLGPVFVRLGDPKLGLGIHGTNAPSSVPGVRSHGCVRMHSANALEFAKAVKSGADAAVIYQMASLNADEADHLWLAAYRDPYAQKNLDRDALQSSIEQWASNHQLQVQQPRVAGVLKARNGRLVCITCDGQKNKVQGSLRALSWQNGSGVLIEPEAVFAAPTESAEDVLLPMGSGIEVAADDPIAVDGHRSTVPLRARERPLLPVKTH